MATRSIPSLSGVYTRDRSRISVEAGIDGFKPWVFADLSPDLVLLRGVDVKLSGRMQIEATGQGEIRTVGVDITGGAGNVTLPGILQAAHEVRGLTASLLRRHHAAHGQYRQGRDGFWRCQDSRYRQWHTDL